MSDKPGPRGNDVFCCFAVLYTAKQQKTSHFPPWLNSYLKDGYAYISL